jgi:hypothetical protein
MCFSCSKLARQELADAEAEAADLGVAAAAEDGGGGEEGVLAGMGLSEEEATGAAARIQVMVASGTKPRVQKRSRVTRVPVTQAIQRGKLARRELEAERRAAAAAAAALAAEIASAELAAADEQILKARCFIGTGRTALRCAAPAVLSPESATGGGHRGGAGERQGGVPGGAAGQSGEGGHGGGGGGARASLGPGAGGG